MPTENRLFDDLTRLAGGAFSSFSALKDETESRIIVQLERILARKNLVRRDEFEAVRDMAIKAREESITLADRLNDLENSIATKNKVSRQSKGSQSKGNK